MDPRQRRSKIEKVQLDSLRVPPAGKAQQPFEAGTAGDGDGTDTDGTANAPDAPIARHAARYPSTSGSATISTSSMVTA